MGIDVDKRPVCFNREAGNQAMVKCHSLVKFIDRWKSSVTHDLATSWHPSKKESKTWGRNYHLNVSALFR